MSFIKNQKRLSKWIFVAGIGLILYLIAGFLPGAKIFMPLRWRYLARAPQGTVALVPFAGDHTLNVRGKIENGIAQGFQRYDGAWRTKEWREEQLNSSDWQDDPPDVHLPFWYGQAVDYGSSYVQYPHGICAYQYALTKSRLIFAKGRCTDGLADIPSAIIFCVLLLPLSVGGYYLGRYGIRLLENL
jgi:hypothetical protein